MLSISTMAKTHVKRGFLCWGGNISKTMGILDFIFPKTCVNCSRVGRYLCEDCQKHIQKVEFQICPVCGRPSISGLTHPKCETRRSLDGLHSFVYYSPPIPQALYKLKYKFVRDLAEDLLGEASLEKLDIFSGFSVVTVPLHQKRENWRGFDQVRLLAELLAGKLGIEFKESVLVRKKETKAQVGLSREARAENVARAFECVDREFVKDKNLVLFDDVWTSGATLKNAGAELKKAGAAKVWGLTLARSR